MTKTFDSTRIQVKAVNVIPEKATEVYNYVRFLVYQSLRDSAKKTYDTYTKILEETTLKDADFETVTREELYSVHDEKFDINKFLDARTNLIDARSELAALNGKGVNIETFNALLEIDRTFLMLQAHTCISSIKLDEKCLIDGKDENGNDKMCDFSTLITAYYKKGTGVTAFKKMLTSIFHRMFSESGVMFYGVNVKKSDISEECVRHFIASFGGTASRNSHKDGDTTVWDNYTYQVKNDKQKVLSSLTDLFAVIFDGGKIAVNRPEETPETPKTEEKES